MKISKSKLKQIIKEELDNMLNEKRKIQSSSDIADFLLDYEDVILDYYSRNNLEKNGYNGAIEAVQYGLEGSHYDAEDPDMIDMIIDKVNWDSMYMY